jgi:hypothetical protein
MTHQSGMMRGRDRLRTGWEFLETQLDPGIAGTVKILLDAGVETFESCEGGEGHAFPEPTVRFHGPPEAGWRALGVCLAYGLRVLEVRRYWTIEEGHEPHGPDWEFVFREGLCIEVSADLAAPSVVSA